MGVIEICKFASNCVYVEMAMLKQLSGQSGSACIWDTLFSIEIVAPGRYNRERFRCCSVCSDLAQESSNAPTRAIALGVAIAGGTTVYADRTRIENPAGPQHFQWYTGIPGSDIWLDVMQPPSNQTALSGGVSSLRHAVQTGVSQLIGSASGSGSSTVDIEKGGYYDAFVVGVDAGTLIPSGAQWGGDPLVYYAGFGSALPENVATYVGIRFNLGGGSQYGWIGIVRSGSALDAFAWGFESTPGVAIPAGAVPEPGSLAMLACGAVALLARRRST